MVISDNGLGNGLANGVDLRDVSSSLDANADVDVLKALFPQQLDGLKHLLAQNFGLHQSEGTAVDLKQTKNM